MGKMSTHLQMQKVSNKRSDLLSVTLKATNISLMNKTQRYSIKMLQTTPLMLNKKNQVKMGQRH